jgi:hypothetical protein
MNLFEIFETGIVSKILPSDLYAILMLTSTSKTVKNAIYDIGNIDHKVDICFTKSENLLYLYDFSKIIKNISKKFIINKLYLQNCIIQKSVYTTYPKNFIDSYTNFKCKNFEDYYDISFLKILNFEDYYDISYLDIIFEYCPSLIFLSDKYYPLVTDILIKFKSNMSNCEIILYKI